MTAFAEEHPPTWAVISLRDAGTWRGGGTPSKAISSYWTDGTIPWVSPKDMKITRIRDAEDRITEEAVANSATSVIAAGSVLIVTRSGILQRTLPVAINDVDVSLNQDLKALTPYCFAEPAYLLYLLKSEEQQILRECSKQGTTVQSIEFPTLLNFRIPLPPFAEQRRIVEAIETQFTRLDAAVAALERSRANLARYRAAVLRAACEGRLVPTEAHTTSGTEFLDLPKGWTRATIDSLTTRVTSGSRDWSSYYGRGQSVFLMAQNVRLGRLDLSFVQLVDPPKGDKSRERSQVTEGDLLVTIVGANTGDVCRVDRELPEHYVCQSVALLRLSEPAFSPYIELFLVSPEHGQKQFERFMYGQGRPHLSFDQLRATEIALPPLAEQERIVAEVERRLSGVERMEAAVAAGLRRAERLRQAILREAFAGRLVPQDPTDEPASVLLERIRAERAAAPAKPKRGRAKRA